MRSLRDSYSDDPRTAAAADALKADRELVVGACFGGLPPLLVAAIAQRLGQDWPRVVISNDPSTLVDDLEALGVVAAALPELDSFATDENEEGEGSSGDRSGHNRRVAAIEAYAKGAILVASPRAAEQPVPDLKQVAGSSIAVRTGEEHDLHALVDRLVEAGYKVTGVVEGRGELAVRGGIVDVYPWIGQDPLRVEFFGDQIDAIRRFDAFTQESVAKVDEAVLATSSGSLAQRSLWQELPPGPVLVLGDLALRGRLRQPHGRREVRLARQLEEGAVDGASLGVERFRGDLRRGLAELRTAADEKSDIVLLARNEEAQRELAAHCADHGLTAAVDIRIGRLSAGFRDLEVGRLVVHDFELAERQPVKRRSGARIAGGSPLSSLTDLKRNDHVVHLRHGIGVFRGMATLEKRGFLEDYLVLEFAEGSKLYVPVDAIDLVQKYVGTGAGSPELSKVGGAAWAKRRAKAQKAVEDLAGQLLQAQAARIAAGGVVFAPDGPEIRRFEAAFPFEETEDQLAATREIKADMERPVGMDRLLCGDVGFGKTEVAMRAAFKAVASGWQVAVLVPTTLLAEQHFENFRERFAGFDVEIAGINRFKTTSERNEVLARAASGDIDILIGTHAILTEKLRFAQLGLLIIDEEHRFGVKQKERLKSLRVFGMLANLPAAAEAEAEADGNAEGDQSDAVTGDGAGDAGPSSFPSPASKVPTAPSADPAGERGGRAGGPLSGGRSPLTPQRGAKQAAAERSAAEAVSHRVTNQAAEAVSHRVTSQGKDASRSVAKADAQRANSTQDSPDVLALSATPIPRTLHFSLVGIRDISVLAEAPAARLAIETRVAPWDDKLIRGALEREFERGGQVFFVHNRVQDIDQVAFKLSRLVPEMKLDIVHGQMPEERISATMEAYKHGRTQCLVTTSIIESGIDIPNANTLFVNNAHFFGLAELHQIRGRIGRFTHQAFAYFLTPGNKELTQEARDRLDAIQEYAELGAGFKLAMRDLELRGAGNLLGAEQSGHIDAIGYELYTRMLNEAARRLQAAGAPAHRGAQGLGPPPPASGLTEATLGLPIDAYIPDSYLETPALKFEVHKNLDACHRLSDLDHLARSVRDRFGPLVDPVVRLFQARAIRLRCTELGVSRIDVQDRQLRLHLDGPLPKELGQAALPELVHLQLDGQVLVLFLKPKLDQDTALRLLCRLMGLDLGFLGRGF